MSWMQRGKEFLKEVRVESAKVSWPTRVELRSHTVVVIMAVILISLFIGAVDQVLKVGLGLLFR